MDNPIKRLNKQFESRVRLGVMSLLMIHASVDFNTMKKLLEVTDGNLSSHVKSLESLGYLEVNKQFVARKPKTSYKITPSGRKAFEDHLSALESLLN